MMTVDSKLDLGLRSVMSIGLKIIRQGIAEHRGQGRSMAKKKVFRGRVLLLSIHPL